MRSWRLPRGRCGAAAGLRMPCRWRGRPSSPTSCVSVGDHQCRVAGLGVTNSMCGARYAFRVACVGGGVAACIRRQPVQVPMNPVYMFHTVWMARRGPRMGPATNTRIPNCPLSSEWKIHHHAWVLPQLPPLLLSVDDPSTMPRDVKLQLLHRLRAKMAALLTSCKRKLGQQVIRGRRERMWWHPCPVGSPRTPPHTILCSHAKACQCGQHDGPPFLITGRWGRQ